MTSRVEDESKCMYEMYALAAAALPPHSCHEWNHNKRTHNRSKDCSTSSNDIQAEYVCREWYTWHTCHAYIYICIYKYLYT